MGNPVYLVCDKCKKIAFVCKTVILKERFNNENIGSFLYLHFHDNDDYCDSAFKLLTEHQITREQVLYEDIEKAHG